MSSYYNACMKTIQQDLKSSNLSLNEATGVAQNRPLCLVLSALYMSEMMINTKCSNLMVMMINLCDIISVCCSFGVNVGSSSCV